MRRHTEPILGITIFRYYMVFAMLICCAGFMYGSTSSHTTPEHADPGGHFIKNMGQWDAPFDFRATYGQVTVFIAPTAITYAIQSSRPHGSLALSSTYEIKGHAYRTTFIGADAQADLRGLYQQSSYHNYFLGSDSTRWRSHVPLYGRTTHQEIYPGIDLHYYFKDEALKYDFILSPGADVSHIQIQYEGQDGLCLTAQGHLEINTTMGDMHEMHPYAYQLIDGQEVQVDCEFYLEGSVLSYRLSDDYDRSLPLVIDPVLIFSTFTGSTADNFGVTATYDAAGNAYAAGLVFATEYPTTMGAYNETFDPNNDAPNTNLGRPGETDMGITKFSADGSSLVYSTYIGGNASDLPHSIIVNSRDELVILGSTVSTNYPVTASAYDQSHAGGTTADLSGVTYIAPQGTDICLTVLSADGASLIGSTYVGGSNNDGLNLARELQPNYGDPIRGEVITSPSDQIYVVSTTASSDFPTTAGAYQGAYGGGVSDAVVMRFNRTLTTLEWSSFFGGSGNESGTSLELDNTNNVFFTGGTTSDDLPVGNAGLQTNYAGGQADGYAAVLTSNGANRIAGTYLGTSDFDLAYFIDLDPAGDVYVLGNDYGGNYPVSTGVYSNARGLQFIHKMNPTMTTTDFSTVFGATGVGSYLALNAFLIDECFRIYVSGWGGLVNTPIGIPPYTIAGFPTTPDAIKPTTDGSDFYFMVLDPDARALEYGSYFGGNVGGDSGSHEHVDGGTSRFDDRGIIYQAVCAGCRGTNDFITSPGAFSEVNGSPNCNLALVKLDFQLDEIIADAIVAPEPLGCAPFTVEFENRSRGPIDSFYWDFGDGSSSTERAPTKIFDDPGVFEVELIAISSIGCKPPDTARVQVVVNEVFNERQLDTTSCPDIVPLLAASVQNPNSLYRWSTGEETPSIDVNAAGRYIVVVKDPDACYVDTFDVDFYPDRDTTIEMRFCEIDSRAVLQAPIPDVAYLWDDNSTERVRPIPGPGRYSVTQTDDNDCEHTADFTAIDVDTLLEHIMPITLCELRTVSIGASHQDPSFTYFWNDGSTDPQIDISGTGTYVVITYPPLDSSCAFTDSFIVQTEPEPDPIDVELGICRLQELTIVPPPPIFNNPTYAWTPPSSEPSIVIDRQGQYGLTITYPFECDRVYNFDVDSLPSYELSPFFFPNAFSPDNNGINDEFRPLFIDEIPILSYHLQIFDRWGGLVFESFDPAVGWDGVTNAQDAGLFAFVWQCEIEVDACLPDETAHRQFEGELFLIR